MNDSTENSRTAFWIQERLGGQVVGFDPVQTLWSGYGRIVRVRLSGACVQSAILKQVTPPQVPKHPRGWVGEASNRRKLKSYAAECDFYSIWCPHPRAGFRTARCYGAEAPHDGWRFLLEDLDAAGFSARYQTLRVDRLEACLKWLAAFHAHFLGRDPQGLWKVGTYWHLATRADELKALEDQQLLDAAQGLDQALNQCRYQTLVHGDAKVANFCFGEEEVAAVDFQYVGGGCGIKDVAYFLSSCLSDNECEAQAPSHLDCYFGFLRQFLDPGANADAIEEEWRSLYPVAWADFHRFLAGWAPDHWKIHRYTREMTRQALQLL